MLNTNVRSISPSVVLVYEPVIALLARVSRVEFSGRP